MIRTHVRTGVITALATIVTTLGFGVGTSVAGPASAPVVSSPIELYGNPPYAMSMTSDPAGNIYYVDNAGGLYKIAANDPTATAVQLASSFNFGANENITYFNGYLYVASYTSPNEVWKVSLDGSSIQPYVVGGVNGPDPEGMAFDSAGNMYIADGNNNKIWQVPAGGGTPTVLSNGPSSAYPWGMTIRGSTLYVVDRNSRTIQSMSTSGGPWTTVFSDSNYIVNFRSITTDPAGNIFATMAAYSGNGAIVEIPAGSETSYVLNLPGLPVSSNVNGGITWSNGYVYFENGGGLGTFYRFADPITPSAPLNLNLERHPTTLTATWAGVPGVTSYTCTLLYGFNNPSNFTIKTPTPNCTFSGLDKSTVYGIQVTANNGYYSSSPTSGFAPLAKWTITCVKGKSTKMVTAVNPRCPFGYHQKP